ncbi:MAG: hypothetical protein A2521_07170 [Deltaproteobacteria bacterium RIFOXYD12_FULL_57_12]|nr:MAG: hypothetical protein A2521_07170 [Deltaproteobacteria bacterium RIFOXYD12_FULL_57_12]
MPVGIEYVQDGIGVVLFHEGVVTGEELINAISRVYADERYPRLKYWIGDRTSCTEFVPDTNSFEKIAELNKKESARNPGMLLALVSPTNLQYGMSRMLQHLAEGCLFRTEIFRDRASAEKWIQKELTSAQ